MTDLVVRGGTVVTAGGSRRADVAVDGGRISAIEADLGGPAAGAAEVIDATGLLVLPGVVDVHTHTRVATDAEPDRFFQDSVAAAFGGTTTFLAFNNPGTGSSPGGRALAADRDPRVAGRDRRRQRHRHRAEPRGQRPCRRPARRAPGDDRRRHRDLEGVHGLRLPPPGSRALRCHGRHGAPRRDAPGPLRGPVLLDAAVAAALARGRPRRASTRARGRRTSRPSRRRGRSPSPVSPEAPVHVVHLSSAAAALDEVRRAKAAGVRVTAETCPHYLVLTEERYDEPDPTRCACFVISPPLRSAADRDALWAGLADGSLDLVATDHVADRMSVEKAEAGRGVSFDQISNGAPGIETLLTILYSEGVAAAGSRSSGWSTCSRRRRHGVSAWRQRAPWRSAATPTSSSSTRRPPHDPRHRPPPHERLHAVRGPRGPGRRPLGLRARPPGHPRRRVRRPARLRPVRRTRLDRGCRRRSSANRKVATRLGQRPLQPHAQAA